MPNFVMMVIVIYAPILSLMERLLKTMNSTAAIVMVMVTTLLIVHHGMRVSRFAGNITAVQNLCSRSAVFARHTKQLQCDLHSSRRPTGILF
jgi:hypothetical protein